MTVLGYGSQGDSVKNLQTQLNNAGYKIAVDGQFGPQTLNAVKQFQQKAGIAVDGLAGNQTFGALSKSLAPKPTQQATPRQNPSPQAPPQQTPPNLSQQYMNQLQQQVGSYANNAMQFNQGQMNTMTQALTQSSQASLQTQLAQLGQARDQQIAQLQSAYSDAISQGQIDRNTAQQNFQQQAQAINQQAYQMAEQTKLSAQQRGISNSMEMLGLQQGNGQFVTNLNNQNMSQRDMQLANIQSRIDALTKQKDLGIGSANNQYNYAVAGAQGQNSAALQQQLAQVHQNYQNQINQIMGQANGLQSQAIMDYGKMNLNQQFNQQNMATQQGYDMQKMATQQNYNQQNMAAQQQFDMAKIQQQNQYQLQQMAQQYGYSSSLQSQSAQNRMKEIAAQASAQQKAAVDEYNLSLQRATAQFTPGTPEYQLAHQQAQAKLTAQNEQIKIQMIQKGITDVYAKNGTPKTPSPTPTTTQKPLWQTILNLNPLSNPMAGITPPQQNLQQQIQQQQQYQVYQKLLNNPMGLTANDLNIAQGNFANAMFTP